MDKKILWIEDDHIAVSDYLPTKDEFAQYFDDEIKREDVIVKDNVSDFIHYFDNYKDKIFAVILDWEVKKEPNSKTLSEESSRKMLEDLYNINFERERFAPIAIFSGLSLPILEKELVDILLSKNNAIKAKFRGGNHPKIELFTKRKGRMREVWEFLEGHYKKEKEEDEERLRIQKEIDDKAEEKRKDSEKKMEEREKDEYRDKMLDHIEVHNGKRKVNQLFQDIIERRNDRSSNVISLGGFWQLVEIMLDDLQFHNGSPLQANEDYDKQSSICKVYYLSNDPILNRDLVSRWPIGKDNKGNPLVGKGHIRNSWHKDCDLQTSKLIACNDSVIYSMRNLYEIRNKAGHQAGKQMTSGYPHEHKQFEAAYEQLKVVIDWYCFQIGKWNKKEVPAEIQEELTKNNTTLQKAADDEDDGIDFNEKLSELNDLNKEAGGVENQILAQAQIDAADAQLEEEVVENEEETDNVAS